MKNRFMVYQVNKFNKLNINTIFEPYKKSTTANQKKENTTEKEYVLFYFLFYVKYKIYFQKYSGILLLLK